MKYWLLCVFLFSLLSASAKVDTVIVIAHLKPKERTVIEYYDDYLIHKTLKFYNSTNLDTVIQLGFSVKNITEVTHRLLDLVNIKEYTYLNYVNPGDTLSFKLKESQAKSFNQKNLVISEHIAVGNKASRIIGPTLSQQERVALQQIKYEKNIALIDSLVQKGVVNDSISGLWRQVSFNDRVTESSEPVIANNGNFAESNDDYLKIINTKKPLNSEYVSSAVLVLLNGQKDKIKSDNSLLDELQTLVSLPLNFNYKMGFAFNKLMDFPEKNVPVYKEALLYFKDKIADDEFMSSSYGKMLTLNVNSINKKTLKIETGKRKQATWNDVFVKNKGRYFMVDLWASWCGPCIEAFPQYELMKKKYEGRKVGFESLNMDLDSKVADWLRLTKELNITGSNYRILGEFNKAFSRGYNVSLIPKYLLFDQNGYLVNDDFVSPTDANFERNLQRYLKEL